MEGERDRVREAGRQSNTADLRADIETAIHQGDRLKRELHEERLWRRRYARLFIIVMVFMVAALAVLGWVGWAVRDCTDPDGRCAKRGASQTGHAVNGINCVTLLANGYHPPDCEDTADALADAGVVLRP